MLLSFLLLRLGDMTPFRPEPVIFLPEFFSRHLDANQEGFGFLSEMYRVLDPQLEVTAFLVDLPLQTVARAALKKQL